MKTGRDENKTLESGSEIRLKIDVNQCHEHDNYDIYQVSTLKSIWIFIYFAIMALKTRI